MEKHEETRYVKRTQKDYSMSFKLQIVQEIEGTTYSYRIQKTYGIQNRTTVVKWLRNSVTLIGKTKHHLLCQSHQIMELEAKVKLLEKQKSFWNDKPLLQIKSNHFDMMIDIARRKYIKLTYEKLSTNNRPF
jgi:transposase-like protein